MEGDVLTLAEMDTKHCFNSMKMCFNHLAEEWDGVPVWFVQRYGDYERVAESDPKRLAAVVVTFYLEIERRGDLPERYREPFEEMKRQMIPLTKRIGDIPLLANPERLLQEPQ